MNRLFIYLTMTLIIVSLPILVFGQSSDKIKPSWIKNPPKSLNNSYFFKVVETDAGVGLETSRKHSQKNLINGIAREFNIEISEGLQSTSTTKNENSDVSYSGVESYTLSVKTDDGVVNVSYERVDEYYEIKQAGTNEVFRLFTLYAVSRSKSVANFDDFQITDRYGARGLWRSLIVPGWGQFYKGSKLKGGLMLGGVAAFALGAIFSENERASNMAMITQTHDVNNIRAYTTNANNMQTVRNICIGGAAALYVYSLIDAVASPGAKRVIVQSRLKVTPVATTDMSGLSLTYKF